MVYRRGVVVVKGDYMWLCFVALKGFIVVGGVSNVLEICAAEGRMHYAE